MIINDMAISTGDLAKRWGVTRDKVRAIIAKGVLAAFNVAAGLCIATAL